MIGRKKNNFTNKTNIENEIYHSPILTKQKQKLKLDKGYLQQSWIKNKQLNLTNKVNFCQKNHLQKKLLKLKIESCDKKKSTVFCQNQINTTSSKFNLICNTPSTKIQKILFSEKNFSQQKRKKKNDQKDSQKKKKNLKNKNQIKKKPSILQQKSSDDIQNKNKSKKKLYIKINKQEKTVQQKKSFFRKQNSENIQNLKQRQTFKNRSSSNMGQNQLELKIRKRNFQSKEKNIIENNNFISQQSTPKNLNRPKKIHYRNQSDFSQYDFQQDIQKELYKPHKNKSTFFSMSFQEKKIQNKKGKKKIQILKQSKLNCNNSKSIKRHIRNKHSLYDSQYLHKAKNLSNQFDLNQDLKKLMLTPSYNKQKKINFQNKEQKKRKKQTKKSSIIVQEEELSLKSFVGSEREENQKQISSKSTCKLDKKRSQLDIGMFKNTLKDLYFKKDQLELIKSIKKYCQCADKFPKTNLGFYYITQKIGTGSYGKVYSGKQILTYQPVAIKCYEKIKIKNKQSFERILQEIEFLRKFDHPNIIKIFEIFDNCQKIFIVTEYVQEGDLMKYIKKNGRFSEQNYESIFKQIVQGLSYLHNVHKILHRDIKLDNILLTNNFQVKICDFGISKKIINENKYLFEHIGTPAYIAPEIIKGSGYKGFQSDVWSLGVLSYICLTGEVPFNGNKIEELHDEILNKEINFSQEKSFDVSQKFQALVKMMLQKDPQKRIKLSQIANMLNIQLQYKEHKNQSIDNGQCVEAQLINFGFRKKDILKTQKNNLVNHIAAVQKVLQFKNNI